MHSRASNETAAVLGYCLSCLIALSWLLLSCSDVPAVEPSSVRVVVIGVDGAEWQVIERLWDEGRLPVLRSLADRGKTAWLDTISNKSPVIWTTMATGVDPERHGIVDFVVATEDGDRPVSSTLRRVPAFWNILSDQGIGVSVFGWWATWPAESIRGVLLSDRLIEPVERRASPESFERRFREQQKTATADESLSLPREGVFLRDRLAVHAARQRLRETRDDAVVAVYLRSIDVMSHLHWREFERAEGLSLPSPDPVTRAYMDVDQAIGELLAAAGDDCHVLVVSDHGFHRLAQERVTVTFDFDRLLEELGLQVRDQAGGIDFERSIAWSVQARHNSPRRPLRLAEPKDRSRSRLEEVLARVTWSRAGSSGGSSRGSAGGPAFRVLEPRANERRASHGHPGADVVVRVVPHDAVPPYRFDGQRIENPVPVVQVLTGGHGRSNPGVFLAAGPAIPRSTASRDGKRPSYSVRDLTPTLLYLVGIAQAEDFSGRALSELFSDEFQEYERPEPVASWGTRESSIPPALDGDPERLDELRALGYID